MDGLKPQQVHASFQEQAASKYSTVALAPVIINIQVLDCRTALPVKNAVIKYLAVQGAEYISKSKPTQDFIIKFGKLYAKTRMDKFPLSIEKTNNNGMVNVPIPLSQFQTYLNNKNEIRIEIGLEKFAILVESFSIHAHEYCVHRDQLSGPTHFKITWSKKKDYAQPKPDSVKTGESWGWSVKTKETVRTADDLMLKEMMKGILQNGTPPPDEAPFDFKLVEQLKITGSPFGNIHPDTYLFSGNTAQHPQSQKQIREINEWARKNFNPWNSGLGFVGCPFSKMTHFVVFALTWYKGIDIYSGTYAYLKEDAEWDAVKKYGIDFVQIKMSEGFDFDTHCKAHAEKAKSVGLKIGYYHWPHPEVNLPEFDGDGKVKRDHKGKVILSNHVRRGKDEAEYIIKNCLIHLPEPDLPLMIDVESLIGTRKQMTDKNGNLMFIKDKHGNDTDQPIMADVTTFEQKEMNGKWLKEFIDTIEKIWPFKVFKRPIIYGFFPYLTARLPDSDRYGLGKYPHSLAHYPHDEPPNRVFDKIAIEKKLEDMIPGTMKSHNLIHKNWNMWSIWQASGQGHIPNIKDSVTGGYNFDKDYCVDSSIFD